MITVSQIIVLSVFLGIAGGFDIPVRHSFVVEMVKGRKDFGNAIALNSSLFNIARVIGPALAGKLISVAGEGVCFLVNSVSYLAAIFALLAIRINPQRAKKATVTILKDFRQGFSYAFNSTIIRTLLLFLALLSILGMPYFVLMPVFVKDIYGGDAQIYGYLTGAAGIGSLFGAAFLASRRNTLNLVKWISAAGVVFGLGLVSFAFSKSYWLSMLIVPFCGFGLIVAMASSNTVVQTVVEEDKRGRVMSLYTMAFMGMAPLGSLFAGILAERIGAPKTLMICGGACIVGSLFFAGRLSLLIKLVRPFHEKHGIVSKPPPEIEAGTD